MSEASPLPTPGKRIVRADEAAHWIDGQEYLQNAREQARQLLELAERQARDLRIAARAEGLAEGQAAAGRQLIETAAAVERYLATVQVQLAELSLTLVRQVLDDLDAAPLIAQLCQRALHDFRDQQQLTLRVPPAQLAAVASLLQGLLGTVQVQGDASLGPRQATLSSPAALVDLDVDEQLRGLRLALGLPDAPASVGSAR
ncbi:HrpE/YscL family type III secretion apparatus protein [Pseudomonas sp. CFBP 8770]|uniref:FliH/SctL family protein n=1 Tax=unclassified Pseudomonas TaxID=196821 RepID=UPI00177C17A5|nr:MULTISPECIES: FliH/SctL family protein [unclassified Pseudomonas]MBD8472955.1 HrpE/YscL family type III secretion apparatus protein [Pseudomonas sp. CFBP 8773]MBD8645942.1 HrpE/YscL family type III secretion apparatus protein [Pseudomonas sp. CFBP 8770]